MSVIGLILLCAVGIAVLILLFSFILSFSVLAFGVHHAKDADKMTAKAVLRVLPKKDCRECGCACCADYAAEAAEIGGDPGRCPYLTEQNRRRLRRLWERDDAPAQDNWRG